MLDEHCLQFGYGVIDYARDLCVKNRIGAGNFGAVNRAVLRRRGHQAARLVAVKVVQLLRCMALLIGWGRNFMVKATTTICWLKRS